MPLLYDKFPPTAEDVHYEPSLVSRVNSDFDDGVDNVVLFTIGMEDAYSLARDIEKTEDGMVDLGEVRRGLSRAASVLIEAARLSYEKGAEHFIQINVERAKQGAQT